MIRRLPFALLLVAAAAFAHELPNYDASAALRVEPSDAVRAAATRAAGSVKIPTEWYPQYGTPSFRWVGGAEPAVEAAALADSSGAYVSEVHDIGRGPIIVRYRQRIDGVEVFRNELNVVMRRDRKVIAVSGHLAEHASSAAHIESKSASPFCLSASDAAHVALDELEVGATVSRTERVWFDLGTSLEPAYYLEAADDTSMVGYVFSAADGRLLFRKNLTEDAGQAFTYRVWADPAGTRRPLNGPQGFGGDPSPTGTNDGFQAPFVSTTLVTLANGPISIGDPWLAPTATVTTGNNAEAYADLVTPDGFSSGDIRGALSSATTFDYTYDTTAQPNALTTQRLAAITQLFYDVNYLHDWFYDSGFNEAARNAQADNYGRGGTASDSIRAEAQDFSGRNNANMSTPADGGRPRMQMFVFDAVTFRALDVDLPAAIAGRYGVGTAVFGPQSFNLSGVVMATAPADGCAAITTPIAGKIAFIDRGTCGFAVKAQNAKSAGAIGVVIGNVASSTNPGSIVGMACAGTTCTAAEQALIPSLQVPLTAADAFRAQLALGAAHATLRRDAGIDRDGSIDNSIVAHEWAHYLSNRLVANSAGLTSTQARGMGEGWSDFNAMLLIVRPEDVAVPSNATYNGAFPLAGYVTSGGGNGPDPNGGYYFGIRRVPYSTDMSRDPLTLQHISRGVAIGGAPVAFGADGGNNFEVHATGEVWTTMLWECYAALLRDTLGDHPRLTFDQAQKRMRDYLVASLKITPFDPTFLDARNALLAAAFATDPVDFQEFWQAFAKRGAGILATISERYSIINAGVSEDFTVGPDATITAVSINDTASTCKKNGLLEGGETGQLTVTIRNIGNLHLNATTGHVTSDDPRLIIGSGGTLAFSPSDPGQSVSGAVSVSLLPGTVAFTPNITVTVSDPIFVSGDAESTTAFRVNVHDEPKQSASDDFETLGKGWTPTNTARWSVIELSPTQHLWEASERFNSTDASLMSPPLAVSPTRALRITFHHRHWFDITTDANGNTLAIDGGVVEISTDGGQTWSDIGNLASPGYGTTLLLGSNQNPLQGRRAFIGLSPGATLETPTTAPFTTSVIDLGTAFAGQVVRIRFRIATGASHSGAPLLGWQIDDVNVSGITNLPFFKNVADNGLCSTGNFTTTSLVGGNKLQATVASAVATPSGTVELLEGTRLIGAALLVNGVATFDPPSLLAPGTHTVTASFAGTSNFNPSTSGAVTVTVPEARHRATR
jgi:hypothetical protein